MGQPRSTQHSRTPVPDDEPRLVKRMIELATQYGRYGYRMVTGLLREEGWKVNHKRIERLWRRERLKVPQKQPRRRRLWLNDGSCVRLRPKRKDHVWAYDFVQARTHDGRAFRMLTVVDEHTREGLAIDAARKLKSDDVLERLAWLFVTRGVPDHIHFELWSEKIARQPPDLQFADHELVPERRKRDLTPTSTVRPVERDSDGDGVWRVERDFRLR